MNQINQIASMKTCFKCKENKSVTDFDECKREQRLREWCRDCDEQANKIKAEARAQRRCIACNRSLIPWERCACRRVSARIGVDKTP